MDESYNLQGEPVNTFHVVKDNEYVLEINEKNVDQMLSFFQR